MVAAERKGALVCVCWNGRVFVSRAYMKLKKAPLGARYLAEHGTEVRQQQTTDRKDSYLVGYRLTISLYRYVRSAHESCLIALSFQRSYRTNTKTICKECCAPREYMTKEDQPGAMRALGRHLTWSTFSPWCSLSVHMQLARTPA
ncbi:hypothetical protein PYCCODRAFT_823637 [Trametes coccinea BRFM310]|uniref:Uncharacterized protein n=1 Tax=Trametes coccinea (strain BRFM310) TaxID=1353009 RepID=A0A1Y2IET9_TRAC3|nr:hypothetical protein PYCCODRAFT_823637 [Trametes coccinea BRFM310]